MVMRIGMDERIQYASPSTIRVLGWLPEQLLGRSALTGVNPEDMPRLSEAVKALRCSQAEDARITYRTRNRDRSEIWVESTLRVTRNANGEPAGVIAILRDVTQQKDLEERLETLATVDGLTGIANRRRFDERLLEEWGRAYRERTCLGVLMIDLDHFKWYNDKYGHQAGDECLRAWLPGPWRRKRTGPRISSRDMAARNSLCCCRTPMRPVARGSGSDSGARFAMPASLMSRTCRPAS
jgi:PAS domain S-box-containing protein